MPSYAEGAVMIASREAKAQRRQMTAETKTEAHARNRSAAEPLAPRALLLPHPQHLGSTALLGRTPCRDKKRRKRTRETAQLSPSVGVQEMCVDH
ncbi:hypothetical protein CapIbe_001772 [Capra ibex]